jgi:hypothetical protein
VPRPEFDPDKHCGAHPGSPKGPCRAEKGAGTDHKGYGRCRHHGGRTPNGRVAAQGEIAREAVITYGLPRHIPPAQALLEEVARTAGAIDWLRIQIERVGGDRPENLILGTMVRRTTSELTGRTETTEVSATLHPWLKLYREERKHLVAVSAAAVQAGAIQRQVDLAERTGAVIAETLTAVLADLQLTAEQRAVAQEAVPRRLRLLAGRLDTPA